MSMQSLYCILCLIIILQRISQSATRNFVYYDFGKEVSLYIYARVVHTKLFPREIYVY